VQEKEGSGDVGEREREREREKGASRHPPQRYRYATRSENAETRAARGRWRRFFVNDEDTSTDALTVPPVQCRDKDGGNVDAAERIKMEEPPALRD